MITVQKSKHSIQIVGHAGYAEEGKDIVCAGVSTLFFTMKNALSMLTSFKGKEYEPDRGLAFLTWDDKEMNHDAALIIETFLVGIRLIREAYPDYVKLEIIETDP